jgi:DNA-binding winged helix-turn-helix (wHTH) protein/Tol biopolymer transport system component
MSLVAVQFGPFQLDPTKRLLLRNGEPIALTPKAFDALVLLVQRRDRVVSKQELLAALWPDTAVEESTLSQHVFLVRRALGDSGHTKPQYIATIARRGYRFIGAVMPAEPGAMHATVTDVTETARHSHWRNTVALMTITVIVAAVVTWQIRGIAPPPRLAHLALPIPADQQLWRRARGGPALSPDGHDVVYAANGQLYFRPLDKGDARPVPGTNLDVSTPFFSPDGRSLGFWSARDSTIKTVGRTGGAAVTVGRSSNPRGASWFGDRIVIAEGGVGIVALPASGGDPVVWLAPDRHEMLRNPQVLPGGDAVLFVAAVVTGNLATRTDVDVYTRATHSRKRLIPNARAARFVEGGSIVYVIGTTVFASRFDRDRLQLVGEATSIAEDVSVLTDVDASADGTLIYVRRADADQPPRRLVIVDAEGVPHPMRGPASSYQNPRVSPDGTRLAFATDDEGGTIWIGDLADTAHAQRLTFHGRANFPVWSPDGRRIAFGSSRPGEIGIFVQPVNRTRAAERLTTAEDGFEHQPTSWSADGDTLLFMKVKAGIKDTIWTVTLAGTHRTAQILSVPGSNQMFPAVSPDQRWIAYMSEGEAGDSTPQIYVQPFPLTEPKLQLSRKGGDAPAWSPDGTRVFYHDVTSRKVMAVPIKTRPELQFGDASVVGDVILRDGGYDVVPDGRLVVALDEPPANRTQQINVVLNWPEELKHRVPIR